MEIKQIYTTQIVSYEQDSYKAELTVELVDGKAVGVSHALLFEGGKNLGLMSYEGSGEFAPQLEVENKEAVVAFLASLKSEFCTQYGIEEPIEDEHTTLPPEEEAEMLDEDGKASEEENMEESTEEMEITTDEVGVLSDVTAIEEALLGDDTPEEEHTAITENVSEESEMLSNEETPTVAVDSVSQDSEMATENVSDNG